MPLPRLYTELAHLWPLLSPPEDYVAEARAIERAILKRLPRGHEQSEPMPDPMPGPARPAARATARPTLLEFGTGGGHTLSHLKHTFDCVAMDIAEPMLANARKLNPEVEHHLGDMRTWRIDPQCDRQFDVVVVHDAIDYMTTAADVGLVLANARSHLKPGGLVLFAPTSVTETWTPDDVAVDQQVGPDGERLTYVSYAYDPDPDDTCIQTVMVFLIRRGSDVRVERDGDVLGLFSVDQWIGMLEAAGFEAEVEPLVDVSPVSPVDTGDTGDQTAAGDGAGAGVETGDGAAPFATEAAQGEPMTPLFLGRLPMP